MEPADKYSTNKNIFSRRPLEKYQFLECEKIQILKTRCSVEKNGSVAEFCKKCPSERTDVFFRPSRTHVKKREKIQ